MANTVKVVIAMGVAGLVNMAMLIMAASTFYYQGLTQVATIEDAYLTLQPLLGAAAGAVFAISLLASGLSSASVGTMAGPVIMQGFLHQHIKPWIRRLVTMLPSLIVIALGLNPTRVLVLLFTTMMLLTACRQTAAPADADLSQRPIKAVTTIGMIGDIVRNVGGERVNVIGLMGPGVDPHLYKASEGDVIRLGEADIVFYNGLHLEAAMSRVFERMGDQIKTVAVTDYIDRDRLFTPEQFEGNYDPHVWFDVTMWMGATERVRDALIEIDPAHADTYRANADDYLNQLAELDDYVKTQAATVPPEKRVIITAHDAFNYFSRAYGFEVRGLQGISTASEAGTADVQGLAKFIVERKIPAIFIESSVPVRNVEAVQEAVRARGWDVQIGGELFSDAMGTPGTVEGTYIGMVKHNIDTIVNALQR